ncbi:hypothetical protein P2318_17205 [Myxococcaceae bacterium GXIMD 01537]
MRNVISVVVVRALHILCAVVLTLTFPVPSRAHPPADPFVLELEALIDGRDQLIVRGDTLQWHHFDFAAVGRILGGNAPTIVAPWADQTQIEWFPTWSEPVPDEIRFEDASSVLESLNPPLPMDGRPVQLKKLFGRGEVRISQQPTASNGYTLIIEFDDNIYPGARYYGIRLTREADRDGDGVPDASDHCPNSDLRPTVAMGEKVCPSNITNVVQADGSTFNDRLALCARGSQGDFGRCVDKWARKWTEAGLLTAMEQEALRQCSAQ